MLWCRHHHDGRLPRRGQTATRVDSRKDKTLYHPNHDLVLTYSIHAKQARELQSCEQLPVWYPSEPQDLLSQYYQTRCTQVEVRLQERRSNPVEAYTKVVLERRSHRRLWKVSRCNILVEDGRIPICFGQSAGRGTNAGDQQYVCGTSNVSNNKGPSELGTGSRSSDFRHLLTRSPMLLVCQEMQPQRQKHYSPLPCHPLNHSVRHQVCYSRTCVRRVFQIRQWMRESPCTRPWHSEHAQVFPSPARNAHVRNLVD